MDNWESAGPLIGRREQNLKYCLYVKDLTVYGSFFFYHYCCSHCIRRRLELWIWTLGGPDLVDNNAKIV